MTSSHPSNGKQPVREFSVEGVSVSFGGVPALDNVTLSVEPGESLAIIGASGAGKTTFFRVLARSVPLMSGGRVMVGGRDLYTLRRKELRGVRRRIGTVRQSYDLVPQLSAGINASLGEVGEMGISSTLRTVLLGPGSERAARVAGALERLGIGEFAGARTANLSGGQQQRVAVARLLVQRPDLILADEPFAAVDPVTTEKVIETLLELNREGATLMVNLHDVRIARRFPRVVALRKGRIAFDGSPGELTDEALTDIYAGDPYGAKRPLPGPEPPEETRQRREDPVRLAEGRDGVASH